ncbi:MAG TPA: toll/interleukin-1 receptor domain-containing protein [Solirubrobacterales bacterium]
MSVASEAPGQTGAQKVFICYRREETAPYAGRIYDAMVARFGVENVFMDLDLDPGVDFVDRITNVVSSCVALIVVIGPRWAQLQNEDGGRRIEDPDDFVRLEVESGLDRDDVLLVPALVGGARMPRREELPPELQTLARRNALELSESRWRYDVGRLLTTLDELLPESAEVGEAGDAAPPPHVEPGPEALGWRLTFEGMAIAAVSAGVGRLVAELIPTAAEADRIKKAVRTESPIVDGEGFSGAVKHIAGIAANRTTVGALVGGALAIWLARRIRRTDPLRHLLRGLLVGALAGLLSGVIWGLAVYAPEETVVYATRANWDVLTGAISGGILASLIGWLWRPPRVGPAIVAGAIGGMVLPVIVVLTGWRNTSPVESALSYAIGSAVVVGLTLAALLLADRAERRQAVAGSPRSGASHSAGSTGGIRPG